MLPRKIKVGTNPSFSPDSTLLATANASSAYIWEVQTGELRNKFKVLPNSSHVAFAPTGDRIAVKSTSGRIAVYDLDGTLLMDAKNQKEGEGCNLVWSSDGEALHDGSWHGVLRSRDASTGKVTTEASGDMITDLTILPGSRIATIVVVRGKRPTTHLEVRDLNSLSLVSRHSFRGHRNSAGVSPDGRFAWSIGRPAFRLKFRFELHHLDLSVIASRNHEPSGSGDAVAFSPAGDEMTVAHRPDAITRLRIPELTEIETTEIKYPSDAAYSADGRVLFLGGWSGGLITYL